MTDATRKKRFWRRPLVWVFPAITVLLLAWAVRTVWAPHKRTASLIRSVRTSGGWVATEVPAWLDAVHSQLESYSIPTRWLSDVEEDFQTPTGIRLAYLSLDDEDLASLSGLANLEWLDLAGTQVSDAGLAHLSGLTSLKSLDLDHSRVSDAGLAHLRGLKNLEWLDLGETPVSDAGLVHLSGLTNLRGLTLGGTQVSDPGLVHLSGLTKLAFLNLKGTQVSDAGRDDLRQVLPGAWIVPREGVRE